ncbi:MAG: hypothetical protein KDC90_07075 [Ignavibacteriae bacterium]|nr:hypothetical protein [Ignavibacteriota bacterium]
MSKINLGEKSPFIYQCSSYDINKYEFFCENINLEDYEFFDKRILTKREGKTSIEKFCDVVVPEICKSNKAKELLIKRNSLNNILTNVLKCSEKGKVCAIRRDKNYYSIPSKYKIPYFNYETTIGLIDKLISLNYLSEKKGYYDKELSAGKITRIWASIELIEDLNNPIFAEDSVRLRKMKTEAGTIYFGQIESKISTPYPTNIILKDTDKFLVDYPLTQKVKRLTNFLKDYNKLLSHHFILCPFNHETPFQSKIILNNTILSYNQPNHNYSYNVEHNTTSPLLIQNQSNLLIYKELSDRLIRVFNRSSFSLGGRFYGGSYQQLNSEKRSEILIDFEAVTEVDFSSLHINMLYNLLGYDYKGDPYLVMGERLRPLMKLVSLISINAKSMTSGIKAFNDELNKNQSLKELHKSSGLKSREYFLRFAEQHSRINKFLNSDIGLTLQYKDSMIAEDILKHFTKKGIPCLPIHDSFIVSAKFRDELTNVMKEVYSKHFGFIPKLK